MRSKILLDRELESLAGTERERVDLVKASEGSSLAMLFAHMNKEVEAIFELYPDAKERFIAKGVVWYKKGKRRKTEALPSGMEFR